MKKTIQKKHISIATTGWLVPGGFSLSLFNTRSDQNISRCSQLCQYLSGCVLLLTLMINSAEAASLQITASPSANLPALVYIENESAGSNITLPKNAEQAHITSYLSAFEPALQVLPLGSKIDIINADSILHNTHVFDQGRTLFNIATPTTNISVQRLLTRPGLFNVRCDLHPFMNAWIAVVNSRYYAVIEKADVYNINNIKPGHYKLHIQRSGKQEQIIALDFAHEEQKKIQLLPLLDKQAANNN